MRAQQGRPSSPFRSAESVPTLSSSPSAGTKPSISQFLVREDSGTRSITSLTPSVASVSEYAGSRSSLVSDASTAKETETAPSTADLDKPEDIPAAQEDEPTPTEPSASVHAPSIREPSPERPSEASNRPTSTLVEEDDRSTITSELSQQKSVPERTKPDYDEPFDFSYLEPKKKIKLGPRPVAATSEKPRKSGNAGTSLLPAAYRPAKKDQQRPTSSIQTGNTNAHMMPLPGTLPAPPPIPDIPEYSPRPVSRGSVKSMPSQKSSTMTPEKLRLMKAVELRKKQMRKSNPQIRTPAPVETMPEVPKVPGHAPEPSQIGQAATTESGLPEKLDSGIDLEGNRQAEIERQTSVPFQKSQTKESTEEEQPAGLLSSPTAQKDASKNATQLPVVEAQAHTLERILDEPQQAGAERSLEPSQISSQPENAALPSLVSSQNTHAPLSEPVAPLPKSDFKSSGDTAVDQTVDETAFSTFPEDLITDVPAIVTTGSSRPQTAEDATSAPRERSASPLDTRQASGTGSSVSLATPAEEAAKEMSDLAKRRRGLVEPLHIDVDTNRTSVADSLSDNDFLEELQSATFHDARQLSVSKSPGPSAPYFPRNSSYESAGSQSRSPVRQISISNGLSQTAEEDSPDQQPGQQAVHNNGVSPEVEPLTHSGQLSPDSISPIDGQSPNPSLRRNVSSGIKGRIQALNELSNRESSAVPVHIPTRAMSPDQGALFFGNERKAGVRSPHSRTGSAFRLRPNVERAGSASNGVQQSEGPVPVWSTTHDTTSNRNSVSVKARIVRPNADGSSDRPSDPADLHESQIEINHLRGIPTPTSVSQAFLPPMPTPPAEPASPDHRSLHSLRRKSLGRSKASTPAPNDENRPASPSRTSTEEHGGSRTSRFFKRMSTFGSASKRRSIAGPSAAALVNPTESPSSRTGSVSNNAAPAATPTAPVDRDTPPAVQVGDLNVQFPDTLVRLDSLLSPAQNVHQANDLPTSSGNAAGSPSTTPATCISPHPPLSNPTTSNPGPARNSTSRTSRPPTRPTSTAKSCPTASASSSPACKRPKATLPSSAARASAAACCRSRARTPWARGRCSSFWAGTGGAGLTWPSEVEKGSAPPQPSLPCQSNDTNFPHSI